MRTTDMMLIPLLALFLLIGCGGERKTEDKPADVEKTEDVTPSDVDQPGEVKGEEPPKEAPVKSPSKPAMQKDATIVGEVIDIVSYATSGVRASSADAREIIESNARGGNPLGILEVGSGEVYLITMRQGTTPLHEVLLPWLGVSVAVKGDIYRKGDQQLIVANVVGKSIK